MDFHLERSLRLQTKPEHENLYSWAITEIDAQGKQVGRDQIPWAWGLYFTATSCVLGDGIEIETQFEEGKPDSRKTEQSHVIRVILRPGDERSDREYFRRTTYSMFGTDRTIKRFELEIRPIAKPNEQESCTVWGSVSYTMELDFRNVTEDDRVIFSMFVKPETFARYAAKIANGSVNQMVLYVQSVAGFYSDWSPSISTDSVKVLTNDKDEQKIALPNDFRQPPRLGDFVRSASLYINRRLEFATGTAKPEGEEMTLADLVTERVVPEAQAPTAMDPQVLKMLGSVKRASWFVVGLLALIFLATLSRH